MTIIVHENIGKELDDYLERRLRNYEVITPPIPKKPEIVTLEDDDKKKKHHKKDREFDSGPFWLYEWVIEAAMIKPPEKHNY